MPNTRNRFQGSNPYLRWPVVFDEYIKNRDVWRCPSIQHISTAMWIVPQHTPIWWDYLVQTQGSWGSSDHNTSGGCGGRPCCQAWPPGWGGSVTDSIAQQKRGSEDTGALEITIGYNDWCLIGRKTSEIDYPSWWVVCGDSQGGCDLGTMFGMAYGSNPCCCWDLSGGDSGAAFGTDACNFFSDPSFRSKYAPHLGGLNLGFADGHAAWWNAEAAVTEAGNARCCAPETNYTDCYSTPPGKIKGMCPSYEITSFVH